MKKIPSFEVNHLTLIPGVYVSRIDHVGTETLTTYDLRMTRPNYEPVMNTAEVHCMEHLGATFLRNHKEYASRVIYFGGRCIRLCRPSRAMCPDRRRAIAETIWT